MASVFFLFIMFLFRIFLNEFYIKLVKLYGPILVIRIMLMSYKKKCDFWQTFGISEDVKFKICLNSRNQKN